MNKPQFIVIDVETTGLDWKKEKLHGLGVAWDEDQCLYIHVNKGPFSKEIASWLADPTIAKVGHNLRFDILFLKAVGVEIQGKWYDTKLMARMLDEHQENGLKALSKKYLPGSLENKEELDRVVGKRKLKHVGELCALDLKGEITPEESQLIADYCKEDCNNTYRLFLILRKRLQDLDKKIKEKFPGAKSPLDVYRDEIMPLEPILVDMEIRGVHVDKERQKELGTILKDRENSARTDLDRTCSAEINRLENQLADKERSKRVQEKAKARINPGDERYKTKFLWSSPKQVSELVYKELKVNPKNWEYTEKGQLSVGKNARPKLMLEIGPKHKAFDVLKKYEEWARCKDIYGKYVDGKSKAALSVVEHNGKIRGQFLQIPKTGRLSHKAPNMGNMPKGPDVKRLFIPPPGKVFFYFDYSQVEFRIMAHLSKDPNMMRACEGDPHEMTAKLVGVDRDTAKTLNFALLYGSYPKKLQTIFLTQSGTYKTLEQCKNFREGFFDAYPRLAEYIEKKKEFVRTNGFAIIETGYIRRFPEVFSGDKLIVAKAERKGLNLDGQGIGAAITKRSMIALNKEGYEIVCQVHDSVQGLLDKNDDLMHHKRRIREIAQSAYQLSVPLLADVKLLTSFFEKETYLDEQPDLKKSAS